MIEFKKPYIYVKKQDIPILNKYVREYIEHPQSVDYMIFVDTLKAMQGTVSGCEYEYSIRDFKRMYHVVVSWLSSDN